MYNTMTPEELEAVNAAYEQVHYYSNLPRHIKASVINLTSNPMAYQNNPAYVVEGTTTVSGGRLNIPNIWSAAPAN